MGARLTGQLAIVVGQEHIRTRVTPIEAHSLVKNY